MHAILSPLNASIPGCVIEVTELIVPSLASVPE